MPLERKIIDCGESGTTARTAMITAASGVAGEGIFVFTGKGKLPQRPYQMVIDIINKEGSKRMIFGESVFKHVSFAVPANEDYHMPITVYVGNEAANELVEDIKSGKYDYYSNNGTSLLKGIVKETIYNEKARELMEEYIISLVRSLP